MITPAKIDEAVMEALGTEAYPIRRLHQKLGMAHTRATIRRSLCRLEDVGLVVRVEPPREKKLGRPRAVREGNRNGPMPRVFWRRA